MESLKAFLIAFVRKLGEPEESMLRVILSGGGRQELIALRPEVAPATIDVQLTRFRKRLVGELKKIGITP